MEIKPISQAQINYLRKLGYTGSVEGLTNEEASVLIEKFRAKQNTQQPQAQSSYQQPAPQQQYYQQQQSYQQPSYQPKVQQQSYQQPQHPMVANQDYNIKTKDGDIIPLDKATVEMYICGCDKTGNQIQLSEPEYRYFFSVCKTYGLNPFLKDIYAIKFGNQPATFVVDYKVLQQAVDKEPTYNGMKTGVVVVNENGLVTEHEGGYLMNGEQLVGAYCEVYRKGRDFPTKVYAMFNEVSQKTKDGNLNSNWSSKPIFMNIKVAKSWALREAFPNLLGNNVYTKDEMPQQDDDVIVVNPNKEYESNSIDGVSARQSSQFATREAPQSDGEMFNED